MAEARKCSEKGCIYTAGEDGLCLHHERMFERVPGASGSLELPFDEKILNVLRLSAYPLTQAEISTSVPGLDFRRCGLFLETLHKTKEVERLGNSWRILRLPPSLPPAPQPVPPPPVPEIVKAEDEAEEKTVTPETRSLVLAAIRDHHQNTGTGIVDFLQSSGSNITHAQVLWTLDAMVKEEKLERRNSKFVLPLSYNPPPSPGQSRYSKWGDVIAKAAALETGESIVIVCPVHDVKNKFRSNLRSVLYTRKETRDWYWDVIPDGTGHCKIQKLKLKDGRSAPEPRETVTHTIEQSVETTHKTKVTRQVSISQAIAEGSPDLFIPERPACEEELLRAAIQYWADGGQGEMSDEQWDDWCQDMNESVLPNLSVEVKLYREARKQANETLTRWLGAHERLIGEIPRSALQDLWRQVHGLLLEEKRSRSLSKKWREERVQL